MKKFVSNFFLVSLACSGSFYRSSYQSNFYFYNYTLVRTGRLEVCLDGTYVRVCDSVLSDARLTNVCSAVFYGSKWFSYICNLLFKIFVEIEDYFINYFFRLWILARPIHWWFIWLSNWHNLNCNKLSILSWQYQWYYSVSV